MFFCQETGLSGRVKTCVGLNIPLLAKGAVSQNGHPRRANHGLPLYFASVGFLPLGCCRVDWRHVPKGCCQSRSAGDDTIDTTGLRSIRVSLDRRDIIVVPRSNPAFTPSCYDVAGTGVCVPGSFCFFSRVFRVSSVSVQVYSLVFSSCKQAAWRRARKGWSYAAVAGGWVDGWMSECVCGWMGDYVL